MRGTEEFLDRHTIVFLPEMRRIVVPEGSTILQAVREAGLDFDSPCGGKGTCGKCRVRIMGASPSDYAEAIEGLETDEVERGIRLACRAVVREAIEVELLSADETSCVILQECGAAAGKRKRRIDAHLEKRAVELPPPSLDDQRSDFERLAEGLARTGPEEHGNRGGFSASLPVIASIPGILRDAGYRITVVTEGREILGVERGDTASLMLGAAFDIGTTTIVCYLLDLRTGGELSVSSCLNPQVKYGADVVSRAGWAASCEGGTAELQRILADAMNGLLSDCTARAGSAANDVYAVSVVGNTCMHHLFLGLTPMHLARSPFVPVVVSALDLPARELGLGVNPAGRVFILPAIAGFVGADTVGVVLATGLDKSGDLKLVIDIGTNGEMVLGSRERMIACSTAAGPAFEGANITCGMRGAGGAIDRARFGEGFEYTVIGDEKPFGICGSGLLDIVAGLVRFGLVNERGRLLSREEALRLDRDSDMKDPLNRTGSAAASMARFSDRLVTHEGKPAFLVEDGRRTAHGRPILVTAQDVGAVQLAKGAMAAGIRTLMEEYGIGVSEIREVLLAGAFGNYMDPRSACASGLFPGNFSAGSGGWATPREPAPGQPCSRRGNSGARRPLPEGSSISSSAPAPVLQRSSPRGCGSDPPRRTFTAVSVAW